MIHETATIDKSAEIAEDVEIAPNVTIEEKVRIGSGTKIGPGATIAAYTTVGKDCEIHQNAVIGGKPQDKKFRGEVSETIIGDRNVIREFVTINRGTEGGGGKTVIGDDNLIMCYVHIAHDCIVGNQNVISAYSALAGHILVDDKVAIQGMVGIHHFCRIGSMACIGGMSKVTTDVPPYLMADGIPCRFRGLNLVALRRNQVSAGAIAALKEVYRLLFVDKDRNQVDVISDIKECEEYSFEEVRNLVAFIEQRSENRQGRYLENTRTERK